MFYLKNIRRVSTHISRTPSNWHAIFCVSEERGFRKIREECAKEKYETLSSQSEKIGQTVGDGKFTPQLCQTIRVTISTRTDRGQDVESTKLRRKMTRQFDKSGKIFHLKIQMTWKVTSPDNIYIKILIHYKKNYITRDTLQKHYGTTTLSYQNLSDDVEKKKDSIREHKNHMSKRSRTPRRSCKDNITFTDTR